MEIIFPGCRDHKYCCKSCDDYTEKGSCMFLTNIFDTLGKPIPREEAYENKEGVYMNAEDRNLIGCLGCLSHSKIRKATKEELLEIVKELSENVAEGSGNVPAKNS